MQILILQDSRPFHLLAEPKVSMFLMLEIVIMNPLLFSARPSLFMTPLTLVTSPISLKQTIRAIESLLPLSDLNISQPVSNTLLSHQRTRASDTTTVGKARLDKR